MTRRTIVITGASDGIGAAAARRIRRTGANVVLVGRAQSKTAAMAAELDADYFVADFADLCQVRALADKIRSECPRIDVLGNNAGGVFSKLYETADGHEITLQVNYLAPFLLTTLLLDVLVASRATIVNTSSSSQRLLRNVTLADFETTGRRRPSTAYALAKLANILFTRELHRRYHADGLGRRGAPGVCQHQHRSLVGITVPDDHAAHPGEPPHQNPGSGCRPVGLVGIQHARRRLVFRRVLLEGQGREGQPRGQRSRARTRAVGSHVSQDRA